MAKEFAIKFYHSKLWQRARQAKIASVFGLCERCKQPGYIVHHKKELTPDNITDADIALGLDNLRYLCFRCHDNEHSNEQTSKGLRFNAAGDLVQR